MINLRAAAWIDSVRLAEIVEEKDLKRIPNRIESNGCDSEKSRITMVILLTTTDYTGHCRSYLAPV
jgi:hypothetical protein